MHNSRGGSRNFRKGGPEAKSRRGGGRNSTFQCGFQSFSYKSLTNAPAKGGAAARPAPPLNPRLNSVTTMAHDSGLTVLSDATIFTMMCTSLSH